MTAGKQQRLSKQEKDDQTSLLFSTAQKFFEARIDPTRAAPAPAHEERLDRLEGKMDEMSDLLRRLVDQNHDGS